MSQFYARYVPPSSTAPSAATDHSPPPEKRKRETLDSKRTTSKKRRLSDDENRAERSGAVAESSGSTGKDVLQKYRLSEAAKHPSVSDRRATVIAPEASGPTSEDPAPFMNAERAKNLEKKNSTERDAKDEQQDAPKSRHRSVFSKFERVPQQERHAPEEKDGSDLEEPPIQLHGLEPLPQPEQVDIVPERPTYSTLPPWQKDPLLVRKDVQHDFRSLGVPETLLENLNKNGLQTAFPVQATVLPLLLSGVDAYDGDVCISAATGSGKTLAYVLPIVADLKRSMSTKLRAVIVVPTRELVKQVRDLCDICASGTSLKITTAVGSKSLKDEQERLVEEEEIYDPEGYKIQQQTPIDWTAFSMERLIHRAQSDDPLDSLGFVTRYRSKVDILITTPGRLVDHLKSTPGFLLDHVKWLVVDEVDRLLNESYQEWIEAVGPALASSAATRERDSLLLSMRMNPPRRRVKKILLSATMTRDISKLQTLGLIRPKLVVLGSAVGGKEGGLVENTMNHQGMAEMSTNMSDMFHLPASLTESAVAMPDALEKPLCLLQLLERIFNQMPAGSNSQKHPKIVGPDTNSDTSSLDSSSSSDTTSSDEDDGTDSDTSSTSSQDDERDEDTKEGNDEQSPLTLKPRALVFTRSTSSASRLCRLLSLLRPSWSERISTLTRSTASSASSRRALSAFRSSKLSVLIATDRASRGLDVPGLENVISYDVPSSALTYVHRVGRTARAGKAGHAWTFVEHKEGAWFWREIGGKKQGHASAENTLSRHTKIRRTTMEIDDKDLREKYEVALQQLGQEARG